MEPHAEAAGVCGCSMSKGFVQVSQEQCGWYSESTDTQAQYFDDWKVYLYNWKGKVTVLSVSLEAQRTPKQARSRNE